MKLTRTCPTSALLNPEARLPDVPANPALNQGLDGGTV
jgi:hypothetical protein